MSCNSTGFWCNGAFSLSGMKDSNLRANLGSHFYQQFAERCISEWTRTALGEIPEPSPREHLATSSPKLSQPTHSPRLWLLKGARRGRVAVDKNTRREAEATNAQLLSTFLRPVAGYGLLERMLMRNCWTSRGCPMWAAPSGQDRCTTVQWNHSLENTGGPR